MQVYERQHRHVQVVWIHGKDLYNLDILNTKTAEQAVEEGLYGESSARVPGDHG